MTFRLAPMSPSILALTAVLFVLPPAFLVLAALWTPLLLGPAVFILAIYAWIWLRYRPTAFVVHPRTLPVDHQSRARADVRLPDRPLRVDRAQERPPVADHARPAERLRPGAVRP